MVGQVTKKGTEQRGTLSNFEPVDDCMTDHGIARGTWELH